MGTMKTQWWVVAPLAWVGTVVVVAILAWWVIDDAGQGVLAEPAGDAVTPLPSTTDPSETRTNRTQRPTGSPTGQAGPTDGRNGGPTTGPTSPVVPPPTSSAPPPTAPETTGDGAEQPAAVRRTSTWQGEEGLLRVSCTGSDLQLEGATPHDGYEIDKNERRSGSELEVRFRSSDGDRRVEIEVACVGGTPSFNVERSD